MTGTLNAFASQACAQPVSDSQTNTMGSSGIILAPTSAPADITLTSPGTLQWFLLQANHIATQHSRLHTVLYNHWLAHRGWDNQQPNQVRYNAENTFQCVLRHRPSVAIHPICINPCHPRPTTSGPGSDKLDAVRGNSSRNLDTVGRQCARWRACGIL